MDNNENNNKKKALIHKDNNITLLKTKKSINMCTIKKSSLKFFKQKNNRKNYIELSKKIREKKIYKYNYIQKKLANNYKKNIKDFYCDNNSFSIHHESRKENASNSNNLNNNTRLPSPKDSVTIIPEKNNNMNKKSSLICIKNNKYNTIDYNSNNEIYQFFEKIKHFSSRSKFSNLSSIKYSTKTTRNINNILPSPRNSSANKNFNSYDTQKKDKSKTLLNDYNNNCFHNKNNTMCEMKINKDKKFNKNKLNKFSKQYNI